MLQPRIIPCLLLKNGGLVKTVHFDSPKYVGDPINAVRIFNEKEVDELMFLDIDASTQGREPDYTLIRNIAFECRMPLSYGGGVSDVAQFERIVELGVEKVAVSSAALNDPDLVTRAARVVGSQSVVVILDVKRRDDGSHEVWTRNGRTNTRRLPAPLALEMQERGAGEIVLNSIDNDGAMGGYDLNLVHAVRAAVSLPLTVLGGAGKLQDMATLIERFGVIGAAAGSLFVFKGAYRAVLINYPPRSVKDALLAGSLGAR